MSGGRRRRPTLAPPAPRPGRRTHAALVVVLLAVGARGSARAADTDPWLGPDKALHFQVSAAIAAVGYGATALVSQAARNTPTSDDRLPRLAVGAFLALGAGVGKELWDLSGHGDASIRDLTWDAAGTAAGLVVAVAVDWAVTAITRAASH